MKFGIATSVIRRVEPAKSLEILSDLGFKYLELSYENFIATKASLSDSWRGIRDAISKLNISINQIHAPYEASKFESCSREEVMKSVKSLEPWFKVAAELNSIVVIHPALTTHRTIEKTYMYAKKLEALNIEFFSEVSKLAEDLGILVAIENRVERVFGNTIEDLISIIESIGSKSLGICIDTGHLVASDLDVVESIKRSKKYLIALHLHDNNGYMDQHLPPMIGVVNWESLVKTLKEIEFRKPIIFEAICNEPRVEICINCAKLTKIISDYLLSLVSP